MANPRLPNGLGSPQSIYQASTTKWHKVGQRGFFDDGRVFYYTRNTGAAALGAGNLLVRGDVVPNHQNLATTTASLVVGKTNIPVGAITPGATAVTANQYAEGFLNVTVNVAGTCYYKIRSNSAFTSATADGSVELYDPIALVSDATTTVSFHANAFDDPVISATDQQDVLVGVPMVAIPIGSTTPYYGWVQTWGECSVWGDEAIATFRQALTTGTGTAGQIEEDDTATTDSQEPLVGYNIAATVDGGYQLIDLKIRS